MNIPLSGYKMKLSDMLSIIMTLDMSLPNRERSFTKKGPF